MSRISRVEYERNVPIPGDRYQHQRIRAVAEVGAGEDPEKALARVKFFVNENLGLTPSVAKVREACRVLRDHGFTVNGKANDEIDCKIAERLGHTGDLDSAIATLQAAGYVVDSETQTATK